MRIAHISDLHITVGETPQGLARTDCVARARRLIADLNRKDLALDFVVITGDNVNDARPAEYAVLRDVLGALHIPFSIIPGNHDDRAALRASFPDQPWADPRFLYHEHRRDRLRLLALDSLSEGRIGGTLDAQQLSWLRDRLDEPCPGQTMVALHHPPAPTGMGVLDRNILTEGATELEGLLGGLRAPVVVLCGHMHRPFTLPRPYGLVSAAASTAFQFALDPDAPAEPGAVAEPFQYAIHHSGPDGLHVIHQHFPAL